MKTLKDIYLITYQYPSETGKMKDRITEEFITTLNDNEVFVFGSNISGQHYGGAAKKALDWGAEMGNGEGIQGKTYAIPTMFENYKWIIPFIQDFIDYANENKDKTFLVTEIGCGIAGFTPEQIAPMFKEAINSENIKLPKSFWKVLKKICHDK